MKTEDLVLLDYQSLHEINGGDQQSYDLGVKVGKVIHDTLVVIGLLSLFGL